jgi:MFS family permease
MGPALAGLVLAQYGADYCFLSNAISFVAVIGALAMMKPPAYIRGSHQLKSRGNFREALHYLSENKPIGMVILIAALSSFLVLPYITLLPVYAKVIFHGDAATYGWLNGAIGIGALAGTFYLASLPGSAHFRRVLLVNTFLLGISLLLFAYTRNFYLGLLFVLISGLGTMSQTAVVTAIVQRETADRYRGRVISLIAMALFGMLPLGCLVVGYLSPIFGAANTVFFQGMLAIAIGAAFYKFLIHKNGRSDAGHGKQQHRPPGDGYAAGDFEPLA